MSDTPETDKQWADWLNKLRMPIESFVDVARKLERERDEAREAAIALIEKGCDRECAPLYYAQRLERERDEARDLARLYRDQYWACAAPTSVEPPKFSWEAGK